MFPARTAGFGCYSVLVRIASKSRRLCIAKGAFRIFEEGRTTPGAPIGFVSDPRDVGCQTQKLTSLTNVNSLEQLRSQVPKEHRIARRCLRSSGLHPLVPIR